MDLGFTKSNLKWNKTLKWDVYTYKQTKTLSIRYQ